MAAGDIKAGRAFVELFLKGGPQVAAGLKAMEKRFQAMGDSVRAVGSGLTGMGAKVAGAMTAALAPLGLAVNQASDFETLQTKFGAVFGATSKGAEAWADSMAASLNRSKSDVMRAMSTYQSFFVGLGFGKGESVALSKSMTQLAADFASFHGLDDAEAMERFIAAMSGSSEVLDQFGINIKEAAIEQELLKMGLQGSAQTATEAQKSMARLTLIQRALAQQGAIGSAAKTSGSFANEMRGLRGAVQEAAVAVGKALLPSLTPLVKLVSTGARAVAKWAQDNGPLIATLAMVGVGVAAAGFAMIGMGVAASALGRGLSVVGSGFGIVAKALTLVLSPAGLVLGALTGVAVWLLRTSDVGQKALGALGGYFGDLKTIASDTLGGIVDAIKSGDFALAAKIMMLGVKAEWLAGIQPLREGWAAFKEFFGRTTTDLTTGALAAWEIITGDFTDAWVETSSAFKIVWNSFASYVKQIWNGVQSFLTEKWLQLGNLVGIVSDEALAKAKELNDKEALGAAGDAIADELAKEKKLVEDLNKARDQSAQTRERNLAAIAGTGQQEKDKGRADAGKEVAGARKELADAVAELAKARAQAAEAAKTPPAGKGGPGGLPPLDPKSLLAGLQGAAAKLDGTSRGTFNSAALSAFGPGGGIFQQQLDTQKKIEKNTKAAANNGVAFS